MKGICYIIGAGDTSDISIRRESGDFVIAADGGFAPLRDIGIEPDLVVGDFDSLGSVPEGYEVVRHPVEKDDTDMMLAVSEGLKRGYRMFSLLGGMGGRLDHTLANIQTLVFITKSGAVGFLSGGGTVITAINNGAVRFDAGKRGFVSAFSLGDRAESVSMRGLKYGLDNAVITNDVPLGVSNEFTGAESVIEVKKGTLAVLWYEDGFSAADSGVKFSGRDKNEA